jgi:flavin-dependent dehydrogenase
MASASTAYDVIVIGGGPAGATVGTLVAQKGWRTLILERTRFPRFHIGESLMPDTYWAFRRLGMLDKLRNSDFVRKYSVQFVNASGRESAPFYFDEVNPHESSQTWQVLRSQFDQMMLDNAAEHGAEVRQETNVTDVLFEPSPEPGRLPRATGVVAAGPDGAAQTLTARVVVDATGTNALLGRKLKVRKPDPQLRKAAIFAHFKGAARDRGRNGGATLVLSVAEQNGWFWYIPLADDVTSIGVVGDIDYLVTGRGAPEQVLDEEIARCPALQARMTNAERISAVHVLSDFSYNSKVCAGDGWVLVGDAFAFLDPIYSSGVHLALKSGELAADTIDAALRSGDLSAERLGAWGPDFYAGLQSMRKLVYTYYTKGFSFGRFVRENPDWRLPLVDLLVGDVFKPGAGDIFEVLGRYCPLPEALTLEQAPVSS